MKIIFLKKSAAVLCAAIVLAGAIIGICAGVAGASVSPKSTVVVIDPGHGGIDAGVTGAATGAKESDINLAVSRYLKGFFSDAGFTAVLTRKSQGGLYGAPTKGFKMRDMVKRKEIIEKYGADLVISVHQNSCPLASRRGGQVFYDKSSECGKALADSIQAALNGMDGSVSQYSALVGDYYMLKCTASPSVIVECGFLTSPDDEALLVTAEYQKAVAYAIFKGAIAYYS